MADVYYSKDLNELFLAQLSIDLKKYFADCKKIAVKMHFGEPGNKAAFTPKDIAPIIDAIKDAGLDYFLFDTPVMYPGLRNDPVTHKKYATEKGFAKVVVDNDHIDVKGNHLTHQVSKTLSAADGVLVLTHFKGHDLSGIGGAIKNLGMGALTKESKADIHHGGEPVFVGDCIKCGICVKNCPINGLKLVEDKKYPVIISCFGCSLCSIMCPQHVINPKIELFDTLLAEGANAAQSKFKKYYYVSAMINIAKHCDCFGDPGKNIIDDLGYLMSKDAVAIDTAALDIIKKRHQDIIFKVNKKTGMEQVHAAERLGMGSTEYVLKNI